MGPSHEIRALDVLYGVTMGEPGVSRIVSVKVNETAGARSDTLAARTPGPRDVVSTAPEADEAEAVAGVA